MFEYIPDYLCRDINGFGDGANFGDAEGDGYGESTPTFTIDFPEEYSYKISKHSLQRFIDLTE
jgi:hypothetical protein